MRVAFFPERLVVTVFEDASEPTSRATTVFEGDPTTPWRDVVQTMLDVEEAVTMNVEWPDGDTLAGPMDLTFDRPPSLSTKVLALAWLGSQWSQVASLLVDEDDDILAAADSTVGLLEVAKSACAWVEEKCLEEDHDVWPEDLLAKTVRDFLAPRSPIVKGS